MKKFFFLFISCLICSSISSQVSMNMNLLGQWDPSGMPMTNGGNVYNDCWGYTTPTGEEYAIIGNVDSIMIIDVTDCNNPTRVFGYKGGNRTVWRDFKVFGDYVYAVCDVNCSEGLHIFDMSALPSGNVTHERTTTAFFPRAHNIYIDTAEATLYACGSFAGNTDLIALDLSVNPGNPTLIKNIDFNAETGTGENYYIHDLYVKNDTVYASHGYLGYYIWDLTDINNIFLIDKMDTGNYNHSSWPNDNHTYAYYAEEVPQQKPMGIIDLANMHNSTAIDTVKTFVDPLGTTGLPTPHNPYVKNDTMYISYYEDGVKVYDVTNPVDPVLIGYYDTYSANGTSYSGYNGCWGIYPFFESGCIVASDIEGGLHTMSLGPVPCDSISATYHNVTQGFNHHVKTIATADGVITANLSSITAQDSIILLPDFQIDAIFKFDAQIGPCDDTFTPPLAPPTNGLEPKKN